MSTHWSSHNLQTTFFFGGKSRQHILSSLGPRGTGAKDQAPRTFLFCLSTEITLHGDQLTWLKWLKQGDATAFLSAQTTRGGVIFKVAPLSKWQKHFYPSNRNQWRTECTMLTAAFLHASMTPFATFTALAMTFRAPCTTSATGFKAPAAMVAGKFTNFLFTHCTMGECTKKPQKLVAPVAQEHHIFSAVSSPCSSKA